MFLAFSDGLSTASRESFRPYPWDSKDQLLPALHTAINQAVTGVDACYLMFHEALPVGEFFLWKAGGNRTRASTALKCPNWGLGLLIAITGAVSAASARAAHHRG